MAIRFPLLARRLHKWLALFLGVQALIWTVSGLYMTVVHIDTIRGDHFIRSAKPPPLPAEALLDPLAASASVPGATGVKLHWLIDRPTYIVSAEAGSALVDARTGVRLPAPSAQQVAQLADHWFTGKERLKSVRLIREVPGELRGRKPPLWRADFDGWNKPTLYFAPETGELASRRHELWRVFDFLWMLHIMDYDERENVNNTLLRVATLSALAMMLAGAWLLLSAFRRPRRRGAAR